MKTFAFTCSALGYGVVIPLWDAINAAKSWLLRLGC